MKTLYNCACDRQTDRQTPDDSTCVAYVSSCKVNRINGVNLLKPILSTEKLQRFA